MKEFFLIKDKKDSNKILIYWLLSILSILLITTLGDYILDSRLYQLNKLFDIEHYFNIAQNGYTQYYEFAFFPVVPLIMKFFNIFNIPILGMVILNNILCLLSTYLIYNILTDIYKVNKNTVMIVCKLWLFSPIRVFTFVPYTESLFIFLSLISFYLYKKRKSPLLLGIVMGLSVATRSMGSIIFFVLFGFLFIEMIRDKSKEEKKAKFKYIIITYIPATIISCLYPIYLQYMTGSWRYFIDVQYEHWGRVKGNIIKALAFDINRLMESTNLEVIIMILLTFISLFVAIMLIVLSITKNKFEKLDLILILAISILTMFSTYRDIGISAGTTSFFRYIYGLIPMYLLIDNESGDVVEKLLLSLNTLIFVMVTFLFLGNKFIA